MADGPTGVSGSLREESLVDFSDLLYAPTSQKTFSKEDVERQQVVDWLRRTTASQTTSPTLGPLPSSPAPAVLGTETRLSASLNTEGQEELEVSFHALVAAHINDLAIFQRADSIHQTEGRIQALTARPFSLSCGNEHHRTSSSVFPLTAEEKKELAHLREDLSRFQKDQAKSKRELETRVLSSFRNILGLSKTEPWEPSQIIYAVIGDHLAAGGIPFADYFFEKAAEASVASADYYWNKLRAIQQLPPGQLDEKIGEIQKIREALPLMTLAVESGDASLLFPTIRYSEIPEIALAPPEETIGSREQVAVLDALSWGLLYEALLGEAEPNTERLDQLEKERRETVLARLEEAGPIEAQLHADNFLKVATIHSLAGGRIEQAVRVEESQKSNAFYIQLRYDQQVIEQLLSPHHQEAPGNPAFEKLAEINWLLHWEALLSLGAYENALSAMDSSVLPRFQESLVIGHHLENLRKTNPHLFTEEGQWGPHDMTETEIGREASDRTASNYWFSSNETREFGVPLGSASVGALLGYLLGNIPGAVIGGGLGGLGGAGGNHLYNINREEAVWAEDQSLHTGLSRTDGRRAFLNDTRVAWSVGFATLGGMAMAAPVGALTDFTVGGALMGAGAATSRGGLRVILMGGLRASWAFARDPRPVLVYMTENSPQALRLFFGKETLKKVGAAGANVVTEFFKGGLKNSPGGGTGMLVRLGVAGGFMGVDALICGEGNGTFLCGENEVGSIDHFTGAVSGAIMVSEAFSFVLRIKPHGLMVANMFRIGTEWIMQIQQDVPIAQPDIDRMVIAAVDSATMVFFAKTYMRGGHFLRDFPLGRVVLKGRDLISSKVPHAGLVLTPITERGVQRYEAPKAIKLKTPSRVKRVLHGTLEAFRQTGRGIESKNEYGFTRAVTGNVIEIPGRIPGKRLSIKVEDAHLKVNKQRLNQWGIFVERTNNGDGTHTNRVVQDNTFSIDRNGDLHLPRYTQNAKGENLREEVVIPRGKALNHESELAHFGITANEVFSRNGTAYNELIFLEPQVRAKVRFTRTFFTRQGYQQLNEAGQERTRLTLGQRQITVSEEGRFRVQRYEGASYERRINPDGTTEVTLNPHYSPVDLDVVGIGGVEIPIWSGLNASKPRLRWGGAFMSGVLSGGTAKALNKYVFSPAMHGDGEYQSDQRALNYLLSEALTHPYVQWPLGYDTMGAQFWGRAVGIGVNTFANLVFPTYRDTWPGQQTYLTDLDNEELESAFENFTDNMTSLDLIPWVYNEVRNSWDYYEPQALEAFRAVHDQLLRKKDSERIEKVAKMFETMIAQEKEGDLTTTQRRGLRILAAYIAGQLNQDPTASDPALASFRRVKKESPPQVFGDIPPLTRDEDWEFFLDGINMATDKGRDFYLYLEPDHKEEPPRLPSPRK